MHKFLKIISRKSNLIQQYMIMGWAGSALKMRLTKANLAARKKR